MIRKKMFYSVLLFSVVLLFGCSAPVESKVVIKKNDNIHLTSKMVDFISQYKFLIVLSKEGCTGCNKTIVKIAEKHISKEFIGIIVETTGRHYDISSILAKKDKKNVIIDYKSQLSKKLGIENSYFVYYPNGIDDESVEVYEITVKNMDTYEELMEKYLAK